MNWLKNLGTGFIVGKILKGIAEGKYGAGPAWLYGHANGLITIIGVALLLLAGGISWLDSHGVCALLVSHFAWFKCAVWATGVAKAIAYLGAFVTWIGTVNGGVKLDPPDPKNLRAAFESLGK